MVYMLLAGLLVLVLGVLDASEYLRDALELVPLPRDVQVVILRGAAFDFVGSYCAENVLRWALPARASWITKRLAPEIGGKKAAQGTAAAGEGKKKAE